MGFVVVVVVPFVVDLDSEAEALGLEGVFVVEGLDDFEGAGAVVVADHGELVGAVARVFEDFVVELVGFVFVVDGDGEDGGVGDGDSLGFVDFGVPFVFGEVRGLNEKKIKFKN